MIHPCNRCGQAFEPTATQIKKRHWRCPACRVDDNRKRYQRARVKKVSTPKTCPVCREQFFAPDTYGGRRQKVCGPSCRSKKAHHEGLGDRMRPVSAEYESRAGGIDVDFDEGAYG